MRTIIIHCLIFIQVGFLLFPASKADITTPLPTVPTILNPSTTTLNPSVSNPETNPTPKLTPNLVPSPFSSGVSWCVATQGASQMALQMALDYACGHVGTDCSPVLPGGICYSPITVRDHASYAFNSYYQKNPVPNSCNFGGTAVITSTDPSYGTCQYPSTSTSSSVLDTSSASGSTVFGAGVPTNPATSSAVATSFPHLVLSTCLIAVLAKIHI